MILGGGWCECCLAEVGGDWEAGRWWWLRESKRNRIRDRSEKY